MVEVEANAGRPVGLLDVPPGSSWPVEAGHACEHAQRRQGVQVVPGPAPRVERALAQQQRLQVREERLHRGHVLVGAGQGLLVVEAPRDVLALLVLGVRLRRKVRDGHADEARPRQPVHHLAEALLPGLQVPAARLGGHDAALGALQAVECLDDVPGLAHPPPLALPVGPLQHGQHLLARQLRGPLHVGVAVDSPLVGEAPPAQH
mmetsp:Transcript_103589/g.334018  ORF Transcript_103589/g.334018 Transcript_103589/m.334018 type:complete len:205 (-) Transcript_103589:107-721(-)